MLDARGAIETERVPVLDTYHGIQVEDDYQWLEKTKDEKVRAWVQSQNKVAHEFLDALPGRAAIEAKLKGWYAASSPNYFGLTWRGGALFALKLQPPKQQPILVMLESADKPETEKVILDPNELDTAGTTAIDWYVPSQDGKLAAVSLSHGGSEEGALHFYRVGDSSALPDSIPRAQYPTAGGSAAWNADGTGIYYTRFPRSGERPDAELNFHQQIYFHRIGSPESSDVYSLGKDLPRIAEIHLQSSHDGHSICASVSNGDGGDYAFYLQREGGAWTRIADFPDEVKSAAFGWDDSVYLLSRKGAPRGKVLRLPAGATDLGKAFVVVPESDAVVESVYPSENFLVVLDMVGGPSRLRKCDLDGRSQTVIPIPAVSSVQQVLAIGQGKILLRNVSYLNPYAWLRYDLASGAITKTALAGASPVNFDDCEVVREFAASPDGARVPINILRRKDCKLDGSNPLLLYGYGGYGISLSPAFDFTRRLWMDAGGVFAVANIRGGGEFGENWHKAGNLTLKQNVFDDFEACGRYLIERKYTSSSRLALQGASNGGLLMGAVLTQKPELARAVVSAVGIYDSLRSELEPNGAFNVTEFGTVKDPEQFRALYAYSPYHHVVDGTRYPAVFLSTGQNDGRVAPHNSYKMAARLQRATTSGLPVILRVSMHAGHGIGTALSEKISQQADVFAFLFHELDISPPK